MKEVALLPVKNLNFFSITIGIQCYFILFSGVFFLKLNNLMIELLGFPTLDRMLNL